MQKLKKRILQLSLNVLKHHLSKYQHIDLYVYDHERETISPVLWYSRYFNFENSQSPSITNDWSNFDKILNYNNEIVIDVGAAIGSTVRLFSKKAKRVYAFEPQKTNFRHLNTVINLERLKNAIPINSAVSDKCGTATFYNRESHGVHSLGKHNKGSVVYRSEVKTTTLDEFHDSTLKSEEIGLLKIDVEGFEYEVLLGAQGLLQNKKIKAIILTKTCGKQENDIFKLLESNDYIIYNYLGKKFNYMIDEKPKICDYLALRSDMA